MDDSQLTVSLVTLGDPGRLTGGYLYHARMAAAAPANRALVRFVPFPDRRFPLPALEGREVMRRVLAQRPLVVVLDSIAAAYLAPRLLAGLPPGVVLVGSLHQPPGGIDHGRVRTAVQAALDRRAYRRARLLIAASEALAEQLAAGGLERDRIRVVPPGRDVARSSIPAGDLRRGRGAALLSVGNWVRRKGVLELLEAVARLPAGTCTLHLAGDDRVDPSYSARVRARLARPDLAPRVVVHGPVSLERVAGLYAAADVFVLASVREPYGTVIGEAMAAGLPVVGWRAGNLPHLAEDGREGLAVPVGDLDALSAALRSLCEDEALRRAMGEAALRRAASRPTWDEAARLFFQVLREASGQG